MTLDELTGWVKAAAGDRLGAFVLYGSTARDGPHAEGDINTLLIVDAVDEELFAALESGVARWIAGGQPAPLVFSWTEWRSSADAFAIEFEDIRTGHRVLAGRDPWDGIAVQPDHARRQLEHELRGKVLHLRQGYLAVRGDGARLGALVQGTAGAWLTMLRALLRLVGSEVPAAPAALVRAAAAVAGFPASPTAELVAAARGADALKLVPRDPRAAAYVAAVARTAEFVKALR
ncbi:MAG: hypothetical protein ACREF4_21420 [Gammaproteobacteria bacterium]